jgi:hypothetical protein
MISMGGTKAWDKGFGAKLWCQFELVQNRGLKKPG